jgi:hypothetical protein
LCEESKLSGTSLAITVYQELRKEIVETQKIRSQTIGFKITFVSGAIGLILANTETVPIVLLTIPAFASIFFDFLINGYSVSIARIGGYCKEVIEPHLKSNSTWPTDKPLWEQFMFKPNKRTLLSVIGNVGLTFLAVITGIISISLTCFTLEYPTWLQVVLSASISIILIVLLTFDFVAHMSPIKLVATKLFGGPSAAESMIAAEQGKLE